MLRSVVLEAWTNPRTDESFCRPFGTRFPFFEVTPDLRPGLSYAAPYGAGMW
jgi:hypothetical protein